MACTGTEEECRRQCIIDPSSCNIGNAPVNQITALTEELESVGDGASLVKLAVHLLKHFKFSAKE